MSEEVSRGVASPGLAKSGIELQLDGSGVLLGSRAWDQNTIFN